MKKDKKPTIEFVANYILDILKYRQVPTDVKTPMGFLPDNQIKFLEKFGYKVKLLDQNEKGTVYNICK
jgi:hypothetical protein